MLALFLALSRIGNVIFLPGLDLEAVGAALASGQPRCLSPSCIAGTALVPPLLRAVWQLPVDSKLH